MLKLKKANISIFIVPYIVSNNYIFIHDILEDIRIIDLGCIVQLKVLYNPISIKQYKYIEYLLSKEPNLYSNSCIVEDNKIFFEVTFTIPNNYIWLSRTIVKESYNDLNKTIILDNTIYWGNYFSIINTIFNNKKTLATHESSQGYFFIY